MNRLSDMKLQILVLLYSDLNLRGIARNLEVTPASVTYQMKKMREDNLVKKEDETFNGCWRITRQGIGVLLGSVEKSLF